MGADLFGSLAEATCAALVVSASSIALITTPEAVYFPLLITATGILVSFVTQFFSHIKLETDQKLRVQLAVSTILMTGGIIPCTWVLPENLGMEFAAT